MKIIPDHHETNPYRPELVRRLIGCNNVRGPWEQWHPVGFYALDDDGQLIGGVQGHFEWDWLHITHLWVQTPGQRLGTQLMELAEEHARQAGKTGILLDTYEFQAKGFYEKLGFSVLGTIEGAAGEHARYFMVKRLAPP